MAGHQISLNRRGFVAGAAGTLLAGPAAAASGAPLATPLAAPAAGTWTRQAFEEAMAKSGRPVNLTEAQFQTIQARKPAAMKRIEAYLKLSSAKSKVKTKNKSLPSVKTKKAKARKK